MAFEKHLDYDQCALVRSDVTIADDNKLQFYLEEVYNSNRFDKQEMLTWEQQQTTTKTDYNLAQAYFKRIVKATNTYKQNAGGGTTGHNHYESTNQMANVGDEIRKYIQQLASTGAANTMDTANNVQMKEKLATMEAEIKKLTATIAAMTVKMSNNENRNPNIGIKRDGGRECVTRRPQMISLQNMGAYCHSHGFHPVGANHNSTTCKRKKDGHNSAATWTNRLGGNMCWPCAKRVAIKQHEHLTWKGKSAPTN
jgi:hypothetical protein